jgi:hypothetical protein
MGYTRIHWTDSENCKYPVKVAANLVQIQTEEVLNKGLKTGCLAA